MLLVVQNEDDLGHLHRFAGICSLEDDVLTLLCAEGFDSLLSQNPLDGVDYVALAAAVRPQKRSDSVGEVDAGAVGKGFEAEKLK